MNILIKIRELTNLTNSEKELANYIVANPKKTLQFKPKELAQAAFVSAATIYRLINKLGLNGIGELKIEIASSLRETNEEKEINYDYPILESDTPYQIMTNLNQIYKGTIDETLNNADPEELVKIGEKLIQAKTIDVYAASANLFFAQNFKFQMQEIGVLVNVPEEIISKAYRPPTAMKTILPSSFLTAVGVGHYKGSSKSCPKTMSILF